MGIGRFAYGLLLPPMRADLGWSYALAGAMNTSNAAGYLLGALWTPWLLRRIRPGRLMLWGSLATSLLIAASAMFTDTFAWLLLRFATGVAGALVFVAGGLLAARLGATDMRRGGLLIGLYYGGAGIGISLSALLVPPSLLLAADRVHGWAWGWFVLAILCFAGTALVRWPARRLDGLVDTAGAGPAGAGVPWRLREFGFALAGYGMFGVGYIGYMTFVIAMLRDQGHSTAGVTAFYGLLGVAVLGSPRLWARLLDRFRDGRALALLNALLGLATILLALSSAWPVVLVSVVLFGAVFASVVASTTALVRHNLQPGQWAGGIAAFTIVFAAGQIVGPTAVGWIADGPGGLARGFMVSALVLWAGALLAWRQRATGAAP